MSAARLAPSRALTRVCVLALLALVLTACFEPIILGDGHPTPESPIPDAAEPDALTPESPEPDAAEPALQVPRFTVPLLIEALAADADAEDDADDDDPSLDRTLSSIFFNSTRDGGAGREDIWFSQRADASQPWPAPEPATALNSDARETGTALSADGLTLYWSSDRDGGAGGLDVYVSQRATMQDAWSPPEPVAALNSGDDDLISAVADEGRLLLFARRAGDDGYQLWWARRAAADQPWLAPEPIAVADSDGAESDPFLVQGGALLLFSRDGDLQLAARSAAGTSFEAAQPLATLNGDDEDTDPWSDEDLGYVVFASARSGDSRLYEALRAP
jgi:hypothetical protein